MCNFINIKDSIIELRIASGTKESSLQETLLREADLEKCFQTAKTVELFKGKKANIIIAISTEQVHYWFELVVMLTWSYIVEYSTKIRKLHTQSMGDWKELEVREFFIA